MTTTDESPLLAEARFRAMGADADLIAYDAPVGWDAMAHEMLGEFEARWSRFSPDSEIARLNATGELTPASNLTFMLLESATNAWKVTGGRFDPTILDALVAAGYDCDYAEVRYRGPVPLRPPHFASWSSVELDRISGWVILHDNVSVDVGGIAKGFAADLVANEILELGALAALVNLGGDVRTTVRPDGQPWKIGVDNPARPGKVLATVGLGEGALATSTSLRRQWRVTTAEGEQIAHHLIDPATGRPADSGLTSVTVVTTEAVWAEPLAKAAFIAGPESGVAFLEELSLGAVVVDVNGRKLQTTRWKEYAR